MSKKPAKPRSKKGATAILLAAVVCGMVGMSFASVPLYRMFCAATGYAGTTQRAATAPGSVGDTLITVRFDAQTAPGLDWEFRPLVAQVAAHPGERQQVFFRAVNRTGESVISRATYNVTPTKAGIYFDKIQCFCFNEQRLAPGQTVDMGVVFFVDPDILTDPDTRDVREITLSYTMFRTPDNERPSVAAAPRVRSVN